MSEVSVEDVNYNLAELTRLQFVEEHAADVAQQALVHYVEVAPQTTHAFLFANMLELEQNEV